MLEEVVLVEVEEELELVPELEEEGEELLLEGVEGQEQVQLACLNMGTGGLKLKLKKLQKFGLHKIKIILVIQV